jgi:hypothetical protein
MIRWVRVIMHGPRLIVSLLKMDGLREGGRHFLLKMATKGWERLLLANNWMLLGIHRVLCLVMLS